MAKVLIKNNSRSVYRINGKEFKLDKKPGKPHSVDLRQGDSIEVEKSVLEKVLEKNKALEAMFDKDILKTVDKVEAEYGSKMNKVGDAEVPGDLKSPTEVASGLEKPVTIQNASDLEGPSGGRR